MMTDPKQALENAILAGRAVATADSRYPISRPFEVLDAVLYPLDLTSYALGLDVFHSPAEQRYYVTYGDWALESIDFETLQAKVREALGGLTELSDESEAVPNRQSGFGQVRRSMVDLEDDATRDAIRQGRRTFRYVDDAQHWIVALGFVPVISDSLIDVDGARYSYAGVIWGTETDSSVQAQIFPAHALPVKDIESGKAKIFGARTSIANIGRQIKAFDEDEHPRDADGKFTSKQESDAGEDYTPLDEHVVTNAPGWVTENVPGEWPNFAADDDPALVAMGDYKSTGFARINSVLRKESVNKQVSPVQPWVRKHIAGIDRAFAEKALHTKAPLSVFRGVGYAPDVQRLKEGDEFTDAGFVSTTLTHSVAEDIGGSSIMQIDLPAGTPYLYMDAPAVLAASDTNTADEYELLLKRGSRFRVKYVNERSHFIQAELLPDDK